MRQDSTRSGSPSGVPAKRKRGAGYPHRSPFFFHRFVRWLIKICAAMLIGADACFLLTVIAATEDSKRYVAAVSFYNVQLAMLCGWSVDKLDRVRKRCIEEGFLHYEPGRNRKPGLYWVLVHDSLNDAPELGPIGESESDFTPQSAEHPAEHSATKPRESSGLHRDKPAEPPYLSLSDPSLSPKADSEGELDRSSDEGDSQADAWTEVVAELDLLGMADTLGTVKAARGKGLTPGAVLAVVAEYRNRKAEFRGPGAIHWRLTRGRWPDGDGPNLDAKKHKHLTAETQKRNAEEAQHAAEVAEQRRELDRLAELHAPEINALPAEKREELLPPVTARGGATAESWQSVFTVRSYVVRRFLESRSNGGNLS